MFLQLSPLPAIRSPSPPSSKALSLLFRTFEDSLARLLSSLLAPRPPAADASFSYLSRAVDVLSSVHGLADALLSDPALSGSDDPAAASYLAASIQLLDVCNAVSAEVERLHRGRLLLLFAAHLLSSRSPGVPPPPDKVRKAREAIREYCEGTSSPGRGVPAATAGLVRDLARRGPPAKGRVTALGRAIYAVEAVSVLIGGALVASLGGEVDLVAGAKVPGGYAWGKAFNELRAGLAGGAYPPGEARGVEASVRRLAEIIDGPADDDGEKKAERLRSAVNEMKREVEEMAGGLDPLGSAVGALFRAVLGARNTALGNFRLRPNKCN